MVVTMPVLVFSAVMVASGTAAPAGSTTLPEIVALLLCPWTVSISKKKMIATRGTTRSKELATKGTKGAKGFDPFAPFVPFVANSLLLVVPLVAIIFFLLIDTVHGQSN